MNNYLLSKKGDINCLCHIGENLKKIWSLIVDDDESNLLLLKRFLEKMDVGVHLATNGMEAIEFTGLMNVDVVFMDINMPVMDGVRASKKLKEIRPELPIIGVTAEPLPLYIQADGSTEPFDELLAKPINVEMISQVLWSQKLLWPEEQAAGF